MRVYVYLQQQKHVVIEKRNLMLNSFVYSVSSLDPKRAEQANKEAWNYMFTITKNYIWLLFEVGVM